MLCWATFWDHLRALVFISSQFANDEIMIADSTLQKTKPDHYGF